MIPQNIIQKALSAIRDHGANYVYFFNNLGSPEWIEPLWKAGYFRKPPAEVREGNSISFLPWVETEYLMRVSEQSPELVAKIINEMADTTNARVHRDILNIAVKLPPSQTSFVAPKICRILRNTFGLFVHEQVVQLVKKMAAAGLITEALSISRAAIEFAPDPEEKEKETARYNSDEEFLFSRLEPSPRLRTDDYKTILNGVSVPLSRTNRIRH